jgi:hypothetical protein
MRRVPAVVAVVSVVSLGGVAGVSFGQGVVSQTQETGTDGTVTQSQTLADGTVLVNTGGGQQSSGPGGSLSVQAIARPVAGRVFALNVNGSPHTCQAAIDGAALTVARATSRRAIRAIKRRAARKRAVKVRQAASDGCAWSVPSDASGKLLTASVQGGGSQSQVSFRIG